MPETDIVTTTKDESLRALVPLVTNTCQSQHTKRAYAARLEAFLEWWRQDQGSNRTSFSRPTVQAYKAHLDAGGSGAPAINQALAAIRKLAIEAAESGLIPRERCEAIARIPNLKQRGVRAGNWLDRDTAERLLKLPDTSTLAGKRDLVVLGLLLGAGIRRDEACRLTWEQIQVREERPVIVDLMGKGNRIRQVPVPRWVAAALDDWRSAAWLSNESHGDAPPAPFVLRGVSKADRVRDCLSPSGIWWIVRGYALELGIKLAPHDLRRTFAQLARRGDAPLEQIQFALGHSSVATTERYLGGKQNLRDAACDRVGVKV